MAIPDPCMLCRKRGRCRTLFEMARKSVFAWARGEESPNCDDQVLTWQGRLAA